MVSSHSIGYAKDINKTKSHGTARCDVTLQNDRIDFVDGLNVKPFSKFVSAKMKRMKCVFT